MLKGRFARINSHGRESQRALIFWLRPQTEIEKIGMRTQLAKSQGEERHLEGSESVSPSLAGGRTGMTRTSFLRVAVKGNELTSVTGGHGGKRKKEGNMVREAAARTETKK